MSTIQKLAPLNVFAGVRTSRSRHSCPAYAAYSKPVAPKRVHSAALIPQRKQAHRLRAGAVRTSCDAEAVSADKAPGRETYRPESFDVLVDDAVKSIQTGLADGCRRMEVEYPLSSDTSGYKDASDSFIDANIALAISAAKRLSEGTDLKVCVLVPDGPELVRASERFEPALELAGDSVTLGCMAGKKKGAFGGFFGGAVGSGELVEDYNDNDIFIAVNASTVELPTVRKYTEEVVKDKTMILWCLELDTLRADLGLFGFPGKEIQFEFLSQFKSMFYIRQRAYSKSVEVAPFLVNYNGALFR
ncbi:hypothetical protein CYMTET_10908 [Cymbomonas tetramitiformis]|uniref:DUF1995 domain-containing protein n=1 Tax=Cymbomonas tetramitiformis TaxID=36881 RepID=A0AAE0LDP7_9CHLO|nr:hypothetical protein CYMTET_10908 [Cymbomonas tetramitiformis]